MNTCRSLAEAKQWAEQGSQQIAPDGLRSHAARCDVCAEFIRTVEHARALGKQLPATPLGQERHDAMRFRLMTAARQGVNLSHSTDRRPRVGVRLLIAAFVVSAAAAAGGYAVKTVRATRAPAGSVTSSAAQRLSHLVIPAVGANRDERLAAASALIQSPSVAASNGASPPASSAPAGSSIDGDARFVEAWAALRSKRPAEAARHFDALLNSLSLDRARRADILYWSAQSHRQAGNVGAAQSRSAQLLRQYPSSPFACDAALILGEYALANDQFDAAAQYLTKAADSERPIVRERAKRALKELVKKDRR